MGYSPGDCSVMLLLTGSMSNVFAIGVLWLNAIVWFAIVVLTLYALSRQRFLLPATSLRLTSTDAPLVSILVPARNEEHRVLEACMRSILAQDYGRFEVIAVNDRSTDATGTILERLAQNEQRLRVIEGKELPPGWLGKPYAMQQALAHANGDWILATDADMIFEPSVLRTALERTLESGGDACTLIPRFEAHSFWERVMIPTWAWVFLMFTVFYRSNNPNTDRAVGIGGFFLIRRSVLDGVGGYEGLKDEVMEDVRLAERIKASNARLLAEQAPALIGTRMYSTFAEMWECSTKNWFSGVNFSLPFALYCVVSMYAAAIVPPLIALVSAIAFVSGFSTGALWLFVPAALTWVFEVIVLSVVGVRSGVSPVYALTSPLGLALIYAMLFDSSIRITTGRGVTWKGRKIYERSGVRPPRVSSSAAAR